MAVGTACSAAVLLKAGPCAAAALPNGQKLPHLLLSLLQPPHLLLLCPDSHCLLLPPLQGQSCALSLGQEFGL